MQNTVMTDETRRLFNAAYRAGTALGRKFEAADMTVELRQAARQYAAAYEGDFSYMVEMRDAVAGSGAFLSDGQSKGVLNCLMADAKRRLQQKSAVKLAETVPAPGERNANLDVPFGTFSVVFPDGHVTIRIQPARDKTDGRIFAKYLAGPDNTSDFQYFATIRNGQIMARGFERQVVALKVVLTSTGPELGKMGLAYALASSNCFYCGRTLTVPASIHSGMGPDCAAKHGGFYGEPEAPTASEPEAPSADKLAEMEANEAAWYGETPVAAAPVATKPAYYEEADRANRAVNEAMRAKRAAGQKLTYADIFPEDEEDY